MMDLDFVILLSHQSKNYSPIQLKFIGDILCSGQGAQCWKSHTDGKSQSLSSNNLYLAWEKKVWLNLTNLWQSKMCKQALYLVLCMCH